MREAKERVIYNNYNLWADYADDCREFLQEEYPGEEITESRIWDEIYFQAGEYWGEELCALKSFFSGGGPYIIRGHVGRWNGRAAAGTVFYDFEDTFYKATQDCDYWKIWDENGHLFLKCSHHDGTNVFEIKRITDRGADLLDKWENDYNDHRSEKELHGIIFENNFFSSLPHYAHYVYGCKKTEYEKQETIK